MVPDLTRITTLLDLLGDYSTLRADRATEERCAFADDTCRGQYPPYQEKRPDHWAACWHSDRIAEKANG